MKLEVGMYVRYISGFHHNIQEKPIVLIGKVLEITDNGFIKLDTFFGNGMFPIREFEKLMKGEPSFNPIDLIEVGDYVNGIRVGYINKGENYFYASADENTIEIICGYDSDGFTKPLNSIVTKEQFEANAYKVDSK